MDILATRHGPVGIGAKITYAPLLGGERTVIVEAVYDDIKNGRPGFDAHFEDWSSDADEDASVWGYADQITRVHTRHG